MKKLLVLLLLAATAWAQDGSGQATPPPPEPVTLDALLTAPGLWATPAAQFVEANRALGFHWLSNAHDAAQSTRKNTAFLGLPVCQAVARFEGEKIAQVEVQIYDRGDAGGLERRDYDELVTKAVAAVSAATKVQFVPRGKDATNAVHADGVTWTTPQAVYLLEYSCTRAPFRAEFVRLQMTPSLKSKGMLAASFEASRKAEQKFRGADHVTRDAATGDVAIKDVPMVDQGEKGYCVVAACERLFRYYGIKADANELAQLADSSAEKGTSIQAITESLKGLTGRLKIHVRTLYAIRLEELIADYAKAAKKTKDVPLNTDVKTIGELYSQIKPDILRAARAGKKGELDSFKRNVKSHADTGVPLLWSVILGVLPDGSRAKAPAGHMRLIIGYNEKTNELLFSDSWGPGHELKRMPMEDAWAITTHLASVEPF